MPISRVIAGLALFGILVALAQNRSAGQGAAKGKPKPLVTDPNELPKVGGPLSGMATVQRPATLKNVRAWSIETKRHRYVTNYMTASPDGKKFATSGYDGLVRIWDVESGTFERAFIGHEGQVSGLAFSPDGKYLASAGYYNVRIWEMASGMPVRILKGKYGVSLVAWSPDGTKLLTGGGGSGGIAIWDVAANKQLVETEYGQTINSISYSPMGDTVAVAAGRAGTYIADAIKLKTLQAFKDALDTEIAVSFSPDGKQLAVGSSKQTVVYNADSGAINKKLATPGHFLAWRPKGDLMQVVATSQVIPHSMGELKPEKPLPGVGSILSLNAEGTMLFGLYGAQVTQWDLEKNTIVKTITVAEYVSLNCGPSTSVLVPGANVFWDAATGKRIGELEEHKGGMVTSAWGPTGKTFAVAAYDKKIRVFDPATAKLLRTLTAPAAIVALAVSADGRVATSTGDKKITLWAAMGDQPAQTLEGFSHPITIMGWTRDGRFIATADDKQITICSAENGKQIKTIEHPRPVHSLTWSTDGARLFVGSSEEVALTNYMAGNWKLQPALDKGTSALAAVTTGWSPDGATLLGYRSSAIQQWNGKTGKLGTAVGSYASATSPAFWADGKTLCTGCIDRAARYWDPGTGRFRFTLIADKDQVSSINADGHYRCAEAAEAELVAVVMTDKVQESLSLKEFATKYGFKNVPANVK